MEGNSVNETISKVMQGVKGAKGRKIATWAKGLNSIPALVATLFISPYILGWLIPNLTYKNTRRIHEKQDREREAKQQKLKVTG